jgi:hypothetical protein
VLQFALDLFYLFIHLDLHFYLMGWVSKRREIRRADYPRNGKIIGN